MALIEDNRGREIRVGDWGGGTVYRAAEDEIVVEEVQGKVVGFDCDESGWWVMLHDGKRALEHRVRAEQVRCVSSHPRVRSARWFNRWRRRST